MPRTAVAQQGNTCAACAAIDWKRMLLVLTGGAELTRELSERLAVGNS